MTNSLMTISDQEFQLMRDLIYQRFGINLTEQKRSLLVGRLQKLIDSCGFSTFREYYEHLKKDRGEQALSQLIDRISTNHTYFNREKEHFDFFLNTALPQVVKDLERQNRRDLRIWCAGCSTGEEPYMLLMLMQEFFGSAYSRWDAGILATDISLRALGVAREGLYTEDRAEAIPEAFRRKHLKKQPDGNWQVQPGLRKEATFRRFNLMNQTFPFKKPFQIIFCRNVMIYFDQQTRDTLVQKFHRVTDPGGYLFIGHSETLGRNNQSYRYLRPATYQKEPC